MREEQSRFRAWPMQANSVVRPGLVLKNFHPKLSHRILRHIHGVLNIDEKKLIAQFGWKSRDECFKTN